MKIYTELFEEFINEAAKAASCIENEAERSKCYAMLAQAVATTGLVKNTTTSNDDTASKKSMREKLVNTPKQATKDTKEKIMTINSGSEDIDLKTPDPTEDLKIDYSNFKLVDLPQEEGQKLVDKFEVIAEFKKALADDKGESFATDVLNMCAIEASDGIATTPKDLTKKIFEKEFFEYVAARLYLNDFEESGLEKKLSEFSNGKLKKMSDININNINAFVIYIKQILADQQKQAS